MTSKKHVLLIICVFAIIQTHKLFAQKSINFGVQFSELDIRSKTPDPIDNDLYTGIAFDYDKLTSGFKFGLSLDKSFKNYGIQINPSFIVENFSYSHSLFINKDITSGITRNKVIYWGASLPVSLYRKLRINEKSGFKLMIGPNLTYSWIEGQKQIYQFTSDSGLNITTSLDVEGEAAKFIPGVTYGVHFNYIFDNYGSVEFGVSMNQPLAYMPKTIYNIALNNVTYYTYVPVKLSYLGFDIAYYFGKSK